MDVEAQLARVDRATVEAVARQALGRPNAHVGGWQQQVVYGGIGVARGTNCLLRFTGEATNDSRKDDRPEPWSAFLKLTRVPLSDASPAHNMTHNDYWRREIDTYESQIPGDLPDGLAAPRCYAAIDRGDCVHLWLEDIREDAVPWSVGQYGLAGRHHGRFNGQYLAGRTPPSYPWFTQGFLRARADRNAPFWAAIDSLRAHPLFPVAFPGDAADRARALFE